MNSFARTVLLAAMLSCSLVPTSLARSPLQARQSKEPTGSMSGRVTLGDNPAPGVTVLLASPDYAPIDKPLPKTTTDEDGHFQLTHVPAGNYLLQTFTPAFIGPSDDFRLSTGKMINLSDGETVEIDIALTRGGVITGRVTNDSGQPLVQESVHLTALEESGRNSGANRPHVNLPYGFMMTTDDRGVYRLFGVPPGRYKVSAGVDTRGGYGRTGYGGNYYSITYHPDVTDESRAAVVEVTAGGEAAGVDIVLGRASRAYSAAGRIVDAETGRPVAGLEFGYGSLQPNGINFGSSLTTGVASNARGEFRFESIVPGRYAAFTTSREQNDWYSDPVLFQISDADVAGLEIKVHHGATLNGVVVMEGGNDQEGAPKLSDLRFGVYVSTQILTSPRFAPLNIGPDGSFRATGIQAGKAMVYLTTYPEPNGVSVLRIERDGVEQPDGVEIGTREQVSGVRVVLGYGTGSIIGQVKVEGGVLPESAKIYVNCNRVGDPRQGMKQELADSRGRFAVRGLMPGDYQLEMYSYTRGEPQLFKPVRQIVSVTNGSETQVVLPINLNEKQK